MGQPTPMWAFAGILWRQGTAQNADCTCPSQSLSVTGHLARARATPNRKGWSRGRALDRATSQRVRHRQPAEATGPRGPSPARPTDSTVPGSFNLEPRQYRTPGQARETEDSDDRHRYSGRGAGRLEAQAYPVASSGDANGDEHIIACEHRNGSAVHLRVPAGIPGLDQANPAGHRSVDVDLDVIGTRSPVRNGGGSGRRRRKLLRIGCLVSSEEQGAGRVEGGIAQLLVNPCRGQNLGGGVGEKRD